MDCVGRAIGAVAGTPALAGIGTVKGPDPCLPVPNQIATCLNASKTVSTRVSTPAAFPN